MGDFLAFRKMITPTVVQIVFWVGLVGIVIVALGIINGTSTIGLPIPVSPVAVAILWLIVAPLILRFYCELLIVLFRMYESMRAIERNTTVVVTPPPAALS